MDARGLGAVVTGGASGLGEGAAQALSAAGARVGVLDLPTSDGAAVAARLPGSLFLPEDVTDEVAVARELDRVVAELGGIQILVNCAGILAGSRTVGRSGPHDYALFRRIIEVNLVGTFNVIRLAAAHMVTNDPDAGGERGVVVNTASVAAFEGQVGQAAYAASKAGIVGMTLPIARDLADRGVRCCTIAPGLFETPMTAGLPDAVRQSLGASTPFPSRLGTPAEFAALVLAVVQNPMLNGETIRLDGAIRMPPR